MSLSPISFISPNFRDYKNYWLKAYETDGTTPKSMALDAAGAVTVAKLEINKDGFIETAGGALVIPYVDGAYDLWLFPTEATADANDTSNALRLADDITGVNGAGIANSTVLKYDILDDAVTQTDPILMYDGAALNIAERTTGNGGGAMWDVVLSSTVTENTFNIVQCTGIATLSLVLRIDGPANVKEFGATGDNVTDDTLPIQAALDTAYATSQSGPWFGVYIPPGQYRVSNLIIKPEIALHGESRATSQLRGLSGSTGKMLTDDGTLGSVKLDIRDLTFDASTEAYDYIIDLGESPRPELGVNGILRNLYIRDASTGMGMRVRGNVGYIENIEVQGCRDQCLIAGVHNRVSDMTFDPAPVTSVLPVEFNGCECTNIHIEGTASGTLPLKITNTAIKGLTLALTTGFTFDHLIEVDDSSFTTEWAIEQIGFVGNPTITGGILQKSSGEYYGGVLALVADKFTFSKEMHVHTGLFHLKNQQKQSFILRLTNTGGTIQHRIGSVGDGSQTGDYIDKIANHTTTLGDTPTGTDASTAMLLGGKIGSATPSYFIFDVAAQDSAAFIGQANVVFNNTGTGLMIYPQIVSFDVNGDTHARLIFQLYNSLTGAAFSISTIPIGDIVDIAFDGYIK